MKLFDVYPLYDVTPVRAKDVYVYDEEGTEYLDLYGAVSYTHLTLPTKA